MNFVKILKTYPKQSQQGGYNNSQVSGNPGGPPPGGPPADVDYQGYTTGGEFLDTDGSDYVGWFHTHVDDPSVVYSGDAYSHPTGERILMAVTAPVTPNPPPPPPPTVITTAPIPSLPNGIIPTPPAPTLPSNPPLQIPAPPPNTFDPTQWDGQAPYIENGILYKSTDPLMGVRDAGGNLIFYSNESGSIIPANGNNSAANLGAQIFIEGIFENVDKESFLETKKTNFNYFKFPAKTKINQLANIPELDEVVIDIEDQEENPFYIRKKPAGNFDPFGPSAGFAGILLDTLVEGDARYSEGNGILITPDIKNSGIDLRVQIKITHTFPGEDNTGSNFGTAYFSLMRLGASGVTRDFKELYEKDHYQSDDGGNVTYDGQNLQQNTSNRGGAIGAEYYRKILFAELIIPNDQFQEYDNFQLGIKTGQAGHRIRGVDTYMIISDASLTETPEGQPIERWRQLGNSYRDENGDVI